MTDHLRVEQHGAVQLLVLDRPARRNALRHADMEALAAHLDRLAADAATRVLVVTGAPPAFCAGEDLEEATTLLHDPDRLARIADVLQGLTRRIVALPQVTIAAVNGPAVGMGAELAVAMDLRLAAERAWFVFPEVERGLFHTNGVTWLLPRQVGAGRAAEWLLSARRVSADEALRAGLVARVEADEDALVAQALELAQRIAGHAPLSVRQLRALLWRSGEATLEQMLAAESAALAACVASADAAEGVRAFLERRAPVFTGR